MVRCSALVRMARSSLGRAAEFGTSASGAGKAAKAARLLTHMKPYPNSLRKASDLQSSTWLSAADSQRMGIAPELHPWRSLLLLPLGFRRKLNWTPLSKKSGASRPPGVCRAERPIARKTDEIDDALQWRRLLWRRAVLATYMDNATLLVLL